MQTKEIYRSIESNNYILPNTVHNKTAKEYNK